MSKTELAQQGGNPFAAAIPEAPEDVSVRRRAKDWLDRGKLLTGQSREVQTGTANARDFYFGRDESGNVGKETMILVVARRDHALWLKDGKAYMESYDRDEPEYDQILAAVQLREDGVMEGYDYLVWVPALTEFFYYHVAKTALDYATEWQAVAPMPVGHPDFPKGRGPVPAILYSAEHPGSGKKFTWFVPRVKEATGQTVTAMPTSEEVARALELFNNPRPQGRGDDEGKSDGVSGKATKGGRRK